MNWGGPTFVLAIIGMSMIAWIVTSWIRAKHGYPLEGEWGGMVDKEGKLAKRREIELLGQENERQKGQIARLEGRIAVLERIATDQPNRLSAEIETLR